MSRSTVDSTVEPENTPPQGMFATPLTLNHLEELSENPDEWEYEYSTTETETYYVTLDLTTPDVAPKTHAKRSAGRGGTKAQWINPSMARVKRMKAMDRSEGKAANLKSNKKIPASEAQTPQPEADIDDDALASPESASSQGQEDTEEPNVNVEASKVQILGLHTRNPLVSYRGHVYSCQWASNIGTELLFTQHEEDSSLSVLRNLPGGVDLVAASSARIISQSVQLEPKPDAQSELKKGVKDNRGDSALSIPLGHTSSLGRKEQARFLERLMEIKEVKGEEDEVTVYASRRLTPNGWKKYFEDKYHDERKTLWKIMKKGTNKKILKEAKERLAELDRDEDRMKEVEQKWLAESRPQGKGRVRIYGDALEPPRKRVRMDEDDAETPEENGDTPTLQRLGMEKNEGFLEDEDAEEYDEDVEEELIFEEEEYGDEDGEGEDEDTQMAQGWS